jgi:two-component system sensor histidine kinase MprB
MSLRARFALIGALAVAITVIAVSLVEYFVVDDRLRVDLDANLRSQAERVADAGTPTARVPELALPFFRPVYTPTVYFQVVYPDGTAKAPDGQELDLPIGPRDRAVASGTRGAFLRDAHVGGKDIRIATVPSGKGKAVQMARSLGDVNHTLSDLRITLLIIAAAAIVVAGVLGLVQAGAALRPVRKLTRAAEDVAETQDLAQSIDVRRRDEVGRLATSINEMLAALNASREQQRQLVGDASHELRTPLTSLRTNLEVLGRRPDMAVDERERLLDDVMTQLQELTELVEDLVELARDDAHAAEEFTEVDLDTVLNAAVERARLRAPDVRIDLTATTPTRMLGQRHYLERALVNVVDNACKWSPPGGTVEVSLTGGVVSVRDHGPGIDGLDLPHVFDRFYRAPAARALPGSGLGLAIVRRVIDAHGGTVTLAAADSGGTLAVIRLPVEDTVPALQGAPAHER